MGAINPYSQQELEDKGWEFSSEDVKVKPDDGSVTMQSLDEELTALAKVCQSLTADGYVFALDGKGSTPLPVANYNRYWFRVGQAGNNQHALLRLSLQAAGSDTVETQELLSMLNRVGTDSIQDGAVTHDKIADNAVTTARIANNAVTGAKISEGAITWGKLAPGAVHENNIAAKSVSQDAIQVGAVGMKQLDPNIIKSIFDATPKSVLLQQDLVLGTSYTAVQFESMTEASFDAFDALGIGDYMRVTTNAGADEEIRIVVACYDQSDPKEHYIVVISPDSGLMTSYTFSVDEMTVTANRVSIGTDGIASGAVTGAKIASGAVTGAKIASGAVTRAKIGSEAIITDKIDDEAVTLPKLSEDVQATLANVPKQYELAIPLEDETGMTPEAFLEKYGVSVDVIKGLRVGDSLKTNDGYTFGVVGTFINASLTQIQLMREADTEYSYGALIQIGGALPKVAVVIYNILRGDSYKNTIEALSCSTLCPWGETIEAADIENTTNQPIEFWDTLPAGVIIEDGYNRFMVANRIGDIIYLGLYNEPQTDGTAKQIQYSIRLRYNDNRTALTSISFYADEIETGGGTSLIDGVQWAATGQKAGYVMLSGEPTGTIEPVPYNRIWAELYTAGSFDTPTINIKVIYANSTTKTTAIGYSFASNIGTPCLRANCVTTAKIANKAVTADKLGNDIFASKIYALTQDLIFDTRYTPKTYGAAFGMMFDVWADYIDGTGKAPVLTATGTGNQIKKYVAGTVSNAGANRWMIDLGCVYDVDTSTPVNVYAILEWDEADAEWDAITFKKG